LNEGPIMYPRCLGAGAQIGRPLGSDRYSNDAADKPPTRNAPTYKQLQFCKRPDATEPALSPELARSHPSFLP